MARDQQQVALVRALDGLDDPVRQLGTRGAVGHGPLFGRLELLRGTEHLQPCCGLLAACHCAHCTQCGFVKANVLDRQGLAQVVVEPGVSDIGREHGLQAFAE